MSVGGAFDANLCNDLTHSGDSRAEFFAFSAFPNAHHFVTERPNVAQNRVAVTTSTHSKNPREKNHQRQKPLFQGLSSHFRVFLECPFGKLAA
jgi:hypothetical protein